MGQPGNYDADWTAAFYDEYGEQEWQRFSGTAADRVSLLVHTHFLRRFIEPGSRVLEVGAGPGRFTQVLAGLGCRVVVSDLSPVQLALHRRRAAELGFEDQVESRHLLDVCDLQGLEDGAFDAVLCYGGPLSYVLDQADVALRECVRVCKTGGRVLASVMSLWGSCHRHLDFILRVPASNNRKITESGDLTPANWEGVTHRCHLFRASELRQRAEDAGLGVLALSASHCLSSTWDDALAQLDEDDPAWHELVRMELEACAQDGCLDMGEHILLAGEVSAERGAPPDRR